MNIVDRVWKPTAKDQVAGLQQQAYYERFFVSAAVANQPFNTQVCPPDRIRFITSISVSVQPGAAQFFDSWQAIFFPTSSAFSKFFVGSTPRLRIAATTANDTLSMDGLPLFPGDQVQIILNCNAGVAANNFNAAIFGWELPRANIIG